MSLQGKTDDEIRAMQEALVAKVRELGGRAGNTRLLRELGWPEDDYWAIRDKVVDLGLLRRYRARGGAVEIVQSAAAEEPPEAIDLGQQPQLAVDQAQQPREKDLYKPMAEVLRGPWAKDRRLKHKIVEIPPSLGRKDTGGPWTRPDVIVAALRVFSYLPGKYFDLITFEIKPSWALNVTGVYEALAHRRAATQSYLWLHCPNPDESTELLDRIVEEAERHGIGVIVASDPSNYETWDQRCDPIRVEPDPGLLNDFIAVQVSDGAKEELAAWVR